MSKFSEIWNTEVKQLALACIPDPNLVSILGPITNSYIPDRKKEELLTKIAGSFIDIFSTFYISIMIWKVDHYLYLEDDKACKAKTVVLQIYDALDNWGYFQNFSEYGDNVEKIKNISDFQDGLIKLMNI